MWRDYRWGDQQNLGVRSLPHGIDCECILLEVSAHNGTKPCQPTAVTGQFRLETKHVTPAARERETNLRMRHSEPPDGVGDGKCFSSLAFHELQAGWRRIEKIAHLYLGAAASCGWLDSTGTSTLDKYTMRRSAIARLTDNRQPCHGADRGQRLAAKTKRRNIMQVFAAFIVEPEFRCRMAFNRKCDFFRVHADAIIDDTDKVAAAPSIRMSICLAPASREFSTSSFTALAGRSTTS